MGFWDSEPKDGLQGQSTIGWVAGQRTIRWVAGTENYRMG